MIEMKLDQERTYVYRLWDKDKKLLYVGVSNNWAHRINQHKQQKQWSCEISSVTVQEFSSRSEAIDAESDAIKLENPKYNIAGRVSTLPDPVLVVDKTSRLDESYSVHQASIMIGVSDRRVRQLVVAGRLVVAHASPMRLDAKSVHDMRQLRKRGHPQSSTPPSLAIDIATFAAETARVIWENVVKQDFERLMLDLQSEKKELAQDRADFISEMQSLLRHFEMPTQNLGSKSKKIKWRKKEEAT